MCLDGNCKNGSLPVDENTEAASTISTNASQDACKHETAADECTSDQLPIEQSDLADKQTENVDISASSQCQSNETAAGAAFYCHPGTDCYESLGDVVKNANKTSKLP